MDSITMNNAIEQFADLTSRFPDYFNWCNSGKSIPYIGWFWRPVYFGDVIDLGYTEGMTGFMENNKWGYPSYRLTDEQREEVVASLMDMCSYWNKADDDLSLRFDPVFNNMLIDFSSLLDSLSALRKDELDRLDRKNAKFWREVHENDGGTYREATK